MELDDLTGIEGDGVAVLNFVEAAAVGVGAKAHVVDGERAGVLYFGTVFVVLAADEFVDFDFLVDA